MWLRRLLRRRREPPSIDLSGLDRLEELVARVIALLPHQAASPAAEPSPSPPVPPPEPVATEHLLFLPGYELVAHHGSAPTCGARVEHNGRSYCVLRHGPSPLPGDRRRCVFLEAI